MKWKTNVCTFRLDDITPDMDWDRFYRVKAIFDKYKIKPLIGVVPENQDEGLQRTAPREEFWESVRSLAEEGWCIAQHGYRHVYETKASGLLGLKKASEFAGLPFETQFWKLKNGREILQKRGLDVTIFMAPGHTYDRNTLKALKKLGFLCVTDGYTDIPCYSRGLLFVPCKSSRPVLKKGLDTVCIHCNDLGEGDFRELENFLETHKNQVLPFEEVVSQLWYPKKNLGLRLQEKKNLYLYRIKRHVALSPAWQEYFNRTNDRRGRRKIRKRLCQLPRLFCRLCREGFGRKQK